MRPCVSDRQEGAALRLQEPAPRGHHRLCCGTRSLSRSAPNLLRQSSHSGSGTRYGHVQPVMAGLHRPSPPVAHEPAILATSGLPAAPASFASRAVPPCGRKQLAAI